MKTEVRALLDQCDTSVRMLQEYVHSKGGDERDGAYHAASEIGALKENLRMLRQLLETKEQP